MSAKPVIPRNHAHREIDEAVEHYLSEADANTAQAFIDALEAAFGRIATHPEVGSPRYAHELDLPGLRCWPVQRFPHLIFYVEHADHVDVWRVLHGARDIPSWMAEPGN